MAEHGDEVPSIKEQKEANARPVDPLLDQRGKTEVGCLPIEPDQLSLRARVANLRSRPAALRQDPGTGGLHHDGIPKLTQYLSETFSPTHKMGSGNRDAGLLGMFQELPLVGDEIKRAKVRYR